MDEEITSLGFAVSLDCPISLKRIVTPVRLRGCVHAQCFDLDTFLAINAKKGGCLWGIKRRAGRGVGRLG